MNDENDLLQLELAFNAFARSVLDVLIEKKISTGKAIADTLESQAAQLEQHENFYAARTLESLAEFSRRRADARRAIGD